MSVLGHRSRSQWLFVFKKNIVIALVPSFIIQFRYNVTQVLDMTISQTNAVQRDRVEVKVAVIIFRKNLVITLVPLFLDRVGFYIIQMFNMIIS